MCWDFLTVVGKVLNAVFLVRENKRNISLSSSLPFYLSFSLRMCLSLTAPCFLTLRATLCLFFFKSLSPYLSLTPSFFFISSSHLIYVYPCYGKTACLFSPSTSDSVYTSVSQYAYMSFSFSPFLDSSLRLSVCRLRFLSLCLSLSLLLLFSISTLSFSVRDLSTYVFLFSWLYLTSKRGGWEGRTGLYFMRKEGGEGIKEREKEKVRKREEREGGKKTE